MKLSDCALAMESLHVSTVFHFHTHTQTQREPEMPPGVHGTGHNVLVCMPMSLLVTYITTY